MGSIAATASGSRGSGISLSINAPMTGCSPTLWAAHYGGGGAWDPSGGYEFTLLVPDAMDARQLITRIAGEWEAS